MPTERSVRRAAPAPLARLGVRQALDGLVGGDALLGRELAALLLAGQVGRRLGWQMVVLGLLVRHRIQVQHAVP